MHFYKINTIFSHFGHQPSKCLENSQEEFYHNMIMFLIKHIS